MFFNWYHKFFSQPHQPFFSSGLVFLMIFLMILSSSYNGVLNLEIPFDIYHIYGMIYIVFIQFFVGFLFVVFPRFLAFPAISKKTYIFQFFSYFICSFAILISSVFSQEIMIISQVFMLIIQTITFKILFDIHKKSKVGIKNDTKWILIAFFSGLLGHLLFILSNLDFKHSFYFNKIAIYTGFYLFLFMIVFTISQRMIPFFTTSKDPTYKINKSENILKIIFIFLILKVFLQLFDDSRFNLISDLPLFYLFSKELIKWKLPFFKVPAIMWVLYIAVYWIPIGFFVSVVESLSTILYPNFIYEKVVLHIFAVGYFITALVGFGTRVILAHSGQVPIANNFAIFIFIAIQFIMLIRLIASFSINFSSGYSFLIVISSAFLLIGIFLWSCKYLLILLKGT